MSYQPPPPPGGAPPPPPPQQPGQWGPPPGGGGYGGGPSGSGFDPKTVNPLDWAIVGISAVLFIFSFFAYYSFDYSGYGVDVSESLSAWHFGGGGFLAWFAMLFGVAGGAVVAATLFAPQVRMTKAPRVLGLGLFGASLLLYIISIFAHSDFGPGGSHGFSFWLSLILAAIGAVLSLMRVQQTGGQLPGALANMPNIGARGPQGGISGGQPGQSFGQGAPPQYGAPPQAPPPAPGPRPGSNPPPPPPPPGYGSQQ